MYYSCYPSPLGKLILLSDGKALTALQPAEGMLLAEDWILRQDMPVFSAAGNWLADYFSGEFPDPRSLPLAPAGTKFQQEVWDLLLDIPFGGTRTYGDIAREITRRHGGRTMSAQAVGGAVGRNPIAILIPCHRILGARGALTGYSWGLDKKIWLLNHEGHKFLGGTL